MKTKNYINASHKQRQVFLQELRSKGEFVMLNLLKFKAIAEFDDTVDVTKVELNLSGVEAYDHYINTIKIELEKIDSSIIFKGDCTAFLVGPESEYWDSAILVKYKSVGSFIEFSKSKTYTENMVYRTAALEDSRLLPITTKKN